MCVTESINVYFFIFEKLLSTIFPGPPQQEFTVPRILQWYSTIRSYLHAYLYRLFAILLGIKRHKSSASNTTTRRTEYII